MNISEFERNKPKKTFRLISTITSKYKRLLDSHSTNKTEVCLDPNLYDNDVILRETYESVIKDLKEIQKSFLSGE
tara:strand:+ start:864 stop:1088 length:225 start_codon:yes stop_codon:yes gene_type:complete